MQRVYRHSLDMVVTDSRGTQVRPRGGRTTYDDRL